MIQKELDSFEREVLTDIFGGFSPSNFVVQKGILRYDMTNDIQRYIEAFEKTVKPFMDDRGYIDLAILKKNVSIPFVSLPEGKARPIELYRLIQPFIKKMKGFLNG